MRVLLFAALLCVASSAQASGPVERLLQVLVHPARPDLLVVRYGAGAGSHGFLVSRDGGRSFGLLCSASVSPDPAKTLSVQRVSTRAIPATAATLVDAQGAIMFAQYGSTWIDDGSGCSWRDVPELRDKWPLALKLDARDPSVIWSVVNTAAPQGQRSKLELMRRDEAWTVSSEIREIELDKGVLDATLVVGARLYVSVYLMGARGASAGYVMRSDDDGKRWREFALPKEQEPLNLLAVDPTNPDRVMAALPRDGAADTLLLSQDGGATFAPYLDIRAIGGVTFDETGRVYVGDSGDGVDNDGGLYTAAKLGDPLLKIANTTSTDCVAYARHELYACNGDRFGTLDPKTGTLKELLRLDKVTSFVSCPGKDMHALCQNQLNSGPSWCCAGHYPFTPICDGYDVTERPDHGRVMCGKAARDYEQPDAGPAAAASPEVEQEGPSYWAGAVVVLLLAGLLAYLARRGKAV